MKTIGTGWQARAVRIFAWVAMLMLLAMHGAHAQDTVCASVKIQIKQRLTLERQAFDATMQINNTTDTGVIQNVSVVVKVTDESGTPVEVSSDPNSRTAQFFIRVSSLDSISGVDGSGSVSPKTTATIDWLLIPAPGSAGSNPLGKKYLVGATLQYTFGGVSSTLDVSPDVITVKPLPDLTLDYFLTHDVLADDPLTPDVEPPVPFTLGVRVKNTGQAAAKSLQIASAQPKIVENKQGLLINFQIDGCYVDDAPVQNTLLMNFGDVAPGTSRIGRWVMETTLSGTFTEFTATFTHSDELGGSLTSLVQAVNTHSLIHDVRVDLPGRDLVKDFLASDGDVIRVYESDSTDSEVLDRSAQAVLSATSSSGNTATYNLTIPPTAGFFYVRLPDPFAGQKMLGPVTRSDAKTMLADNVWLSKTRNEQTKQWDYWINFFDENTTGSYTTEFDPLSAAPAPPVIQFIPDHMVDEGTEVSFVVEASSPNGRPVTLTAAPLPIGATFVQQPPDPQLPGLARAVFDWTPGSGTAGSYLITYTASDGVLSSARSATIKVNSTTPPPGPVQPSIVSPGVGTQVATQTPALIVQTSTNSQDPARQVQFETYSDAAMTKLVESGLVGKGVTTGDAGTTSYTLNTQLNDNTWYWWRARAYDGKAVYSYWTYGNFFVNLFNDPPNSFNLASPAPGIEVATAIPVLSWNNTTDKDGDAITYGVYVYSDAALTNLVASAEALPPVAGSATSWTLTVPLANQTKYYWKVMAQDSHGAQTPTLAWSFTVNNGDVTPTNPVIISPVSGGESASSSTVLTVQNSTDANSDPLTYVFELDTVSSFDSGQKRTSGAIGPTTSATTSWTFDHLVEDQHYWWRVKAGNGHTESAWVIGDFLVNALNNPPGIPSIRNPGDGSWSTTLVPTLEVNSVTDPEGAAVSYDFEIYDDATPANLVTSGTSSQTTWTTPVSLADKGTYHWRARARDAGGRSSAWSSLAALHVSTGVYQDPTIQMTAPNAVLAPTVSGTQKTVTLGWTATDTNIEATVALYFSGTNSGFTGTLIVDGLKQSLGTHSNTYTWDVTALAPGVYYVYGIVYDSRGAGRAYASGALVVANPSPSGSIVVTGDDGLQTISIGGYLDQPAQFMVHLGTAPTGDTTIQLNTTDAHEGSVTPSLTFTAQNWNVDQTVTVTGAHDCIPDNPDGNPYQVLIGPASSLDPNYMGISGRTVNVTGLKWNLPGTTNNANLHICGYTLVSKAQLADGSFEYKISAELTNTGTAVSGVTAHLTSVPASFQVVSDALTFGAAGNLETVQSANTVTVRYPLSLDQSFIFQFGRDFAWTVTTP